MEQWLYRKNNNEVPTRWRAGITDNGLIIEVEYGIVGKASRFEAYKVTQKNATAELESRYRDKRKTGYMSIEDIKDDGDIFRSPVEDGDINNLFIKKSNIFGTSFTNTRIKNLRCEDIMPGRWTTQLVNKHLGYRYTGVFKTLASIDDKPSRFEILIPLIQTLVRDNVKLNNDVYKELNKFMLDYDKTSSEMRKYLQSINECILLMKNIVHQD